MKILLTFIICVFSLHLSAQIYDNNLLLHVNFDNQVEDQSENAAIVDNYGGTFDTDRFGNAEASATFDGVNDFMNVINQDMYCFDDKATLSLWVKYNSTPETLDPVFILSNRSTFVFGESRSIGMRMDATVFAMHYYNLTGGTLASDPSNILFDLEWHHLAGTLNVEEERMEFFIDGELVGEKEILSDISLQGFRYVFIGGGYRDSYAHCNVDDLRIYNRILSDCEISALYNEFQMEVICDEPTEEDCTLVSVETTHKKSKGIIYPNPSSGKVQIKHIAQNHYAWSVYSTQGKLILSGTSNAPELDLSNLQDGYYILKINNSVTPLVIAR